MKPVKDDDVGKVVKALQSRAEFRKDFDFRQLAGVLNYTDKAESTFLVHESLSTYLIANKLKNELRFPRGFGVSVPNHVDPIYSPLPLPQRTKGLKQLENLLKQLKKLLEKALK